MKKRMKKRMNKKRKGKKGEGKRNLGEEQKSLSLGTQRTKEPGPAQLNQSIQTPNSPPPRRQLSFMSITGDNLNFKFKDRNEIPISK